MPGWLIATLAGVVVVVGVAASTVLGARARRTARLRDSIRDARARVAALTYRIDAAAGRPDPASAQSGDAAVRAATSDRDAAEAALAVAEQQRSESACREAGELIARAERALLGGSGDA